jgi:NtrC-family two-component system sensor histidine kinase KinB
MEHKITELLATARAVNMETVLKLQATDLTALLKSAAAAFSGIAPGIRVSACPPSLRLPLDASQMGRAIQNIIDNALKYSSRDGRPVEISLMCEDDRAIVQVLDHGVGKTHGFATDGCIGEPEFGRRHQGNARTVTSLSAAVNGSHPLAVSPWEKITDGAADAHTGRDDIDKRGQLVP